MLTLLVTRYSLPFWLLSVFRIIQDLAEVTVSPTLWGSGGMGVLAHIPHSRTAQRAPHPKALPSSQRSSETMYFLQVRRPRGSGKPGQGSRPESHRRPDGEQTVSAGWTSCFHVSTFSGMVQKPAKEACGQVNSPALLVYRIH